jgi:hypothetical protein
MCWRGGSPLVGEAHGALVLAQVKPGYVDRLHIATEHTVSTPSQRNAVSLPGFEPGTKGLKVPCSTVELQALGDSEARWRAQAREAHRPGRNPSFACWRRRPKCVKRGGASYCGGADGGGGFDERSLRRATAIAAAIKPVISAITIACGVAMSS